MRLHNLWVADYQRYGKGVVVLLSRWLISAKKKHFYIKLFTYTLVIVLLPILIISLVLYRNITSVMQTELRTANEMYLKQTVDTMEMIVKHIGTSFQQTVLSGAIKEFEAFPLGSYYETLDGSYRDEDLRELYLYVNSKSNAQWYLNNLKESNEFIHSVYYFDHNKHIVLTGSANFTFDDFYDDTWSLSTEGISAYPTISELREAKQLDGTRKLVLPIVYMSASLSDSYVVINLDAEMIYSTVFHKLIRDGNHAFFVLSAGGKLMFYDRQFAVSEQMSGDPNVLRLIEEHRQGSFETEMLGKQWHVTNMSSEVLGWTFINGILVNNIYKSVNNTKNLILFTALMLVAASGVFVFITSRNIYNPIRHLLSFVKDKSYEGGGTAANPKVFGELKVIRSSLMEAFELQESLQKRLKESLPAYKKMYVHSLLRPNHFTLEEIDDRLRFLGLGLHLDDIALFVITLTEITDPEADVERMKMNKLRIEDMIEAMIPAGRNRIVMELIEDRFVVMINCHPTQMTDMIALAERVAHDIRQLIGIGCTIGIGNHSRTVCELQRAYSEAKEAQRHRVISGNSDVIYIGDVRLENIPLLVYPKEKEAALNNYILNGEMKEALGMFTEFVKDLKEQQRKVDFRQLQQAFIRLLGSLVETAASLRLDIESVLRRKTNLYEVLLKKKDLKEIEEWFSDIIGDFTTYIGQAYKEKNNKYVKQAFRLLEQTYCDNISLVQISEQLQLSPSYFSRLFKEHTGQSFSEYVMTARVESGKKLLLESKLLIKDISERIGYNNTNYFIKVFKEHTGLTPGEYRKMHGWEELATE